MLAPRSTGRQPEGPGLGTTGPDQGYAFKLTKPFAERLHMGGLDWQDVKTGGVALAIKRSGLHGRGPVIDDLSAAFTIFGFFDPDPAVELLELRKEHFAQIHNHHHYLQQRALVDLVNTAWLKQPLTSIEDQYNQDWRTFYNRF